MKCKYINKHACCVGCKNDDETGNLECISHELEKHSELFLFEKFWKENFDNLQTEERFFFSFCGKKFIIYVAGLENRTESESIIDVCEQALKYKEEK